MNLKYDNMYIVEKRWKIVENILNEKVGIFLLDEQKFKGSLK